MAPVRRRFNALRGPFRMATGAAGFDGGADRP